MGNTKRFNCGNGEGMFEDKEGHYVFYQDYKDLLSKYEKLKWEHYTKIIKLEQSKTNVDKL